MQMGMMILEWSEGGEVDTSLQIMMKKKKTFTNQGKLANNILSKIVIKRQHEKQSLFSVLHHQSIKFHHGAPHMPPPPLKISGLSCTNSSLLCFHVVESNTLLLNNSTIFNTGLF